MQQFNITQGIKGIVRASEYGVRWSYMISDKAKHKARVLAFWETHGLEATHQAFRVSRRTVYGWKQQLHKGQGKLTALNEGSKRPHVLRTRSWPPEIIHEIRSLREQHPNLGKEKLFPFLQVFVRTHHLTCPSVRTIGRLIADQPDKMRLTPQKVSHFGRIKTVKKHSKRVRKPTHFVATHPGHCGSFDTVEKIIQGSRRYLITFTDVYSRFSFAWATTSHASQAAAEFFRLVSSLFPYPLEYILTDNGSEFAKDFEQELTHLHKVHWHTYPKTPKMNPHVERFNRTLQEEFANFHLGELLTNLNVFNEKLIDYLLWYIGKRPHWGLKLQSPIQFLMQKQPQECNMWWPSTND